MRREALDEVREHGRKVLRDIDGEDGAGKPVHFTAAGAALFQLLDAMEDLERAGPEGLASRSRLGVLRRLARKGPQTISDLARARGASRQGVQRLARALVGEGWVALQPNPRHRRAALLALTSRGLQAYRELARAEAEALNRMAAGGEAEAIRAAARLVRGLLPHGDG